MNTGSKSSRVPVLLLFGPTAVGKTELLVELFEGTAEVVNADSAQVYRGLDIGTAKPTKAMRARLPHHLIDIRNPNEAFDVGEFVRLADDAVHAIHERGLLPIVAGGTAFYLATFLHGMPLTPPSDPAVRRLLELERAERGLDPLRAELERVDPESARRIPRGDGYRLLRALEVSRVSGHPLSSYARPSSPRPGYRFSIMGLTRPREDLYRRIDARVDQMLRSGLTDELRTVLEAGYGFSDPGLRAIGYRELADWAAGRGELAPAAALIARNSRRYAKRQLTFFRSIQNVRWFEPGEREGILAAAADFRARDDGAS